MSKHLHIGMSGWSYWDWKGHFYPEKMKSTDWLAHYALSFDTTEVNSSFYRLPRAKTVLTWASKVPDGFKLCPKMSKYLTHIQKLKDPEEPLERFFEVFAPVNELLGPVLVQLPPSLKFDVALVTAFFEVLRTQYAEYTFALEARNETWLAKEAIDLLKEYRVTWVISQSGVGFPYLEAVTARDIYVRFHGPEKLYSSSYTDDMLHEYALKFKKWIKHGHTVWVYFNNTMRGVAIENARTLDRMMKLK